MKFNILQILSLGFAIEATVYLLIFIGQLKDMRELLLAGGNASGVLAEDDIGQLFGQFNGFFLDDLTVFDDVDGDARINVTQHINVNFIIKVDLDDILLAHTAALNVFDDGNRAIELVKSQESIYLHGLACGDMVDNDTVFDRVNIHHTVTSRSFIISAILIYFPFNTCLK